jgi:serine/threonine protein kinase
VSLLGRIANNPDDKPGLLLSLLPDGEFRVLGNPPSFETITRDTFPEKSSLSLMFVLRTLFDVCFGCAHLHKLSIVHGDVYAHNILVNNQGKALLTDFGAASFSAGHDLAVREALEKIEVRAFGHLIDDLIQRISIEEQSSIVTQGLRQLHTICMQEEVSSRPTFDLLVADFLRMISYIQGT